MDRHPSEIRIDTGYETWVFDHVRRQFCRVPPGRDPHDPRISAAWKPYFDVQTGSDGGFTVMLDAAGTRRHRVLGPPPFAAA